MHSAMVQAKQEMVQGKITFLRGACWEVRRRLHQRMLAACTHVLLILHSHEHTQTNGHG